MHGISQQIELFMTDIIAKFAPILQKNRIVYNIKYLVYF